MIECGSYVSGPKYSFTAIYRKIQACRIAVLPGSHGMVEFDDHTQIKEPVRSHEGLYGVPLHKPHGVSKLGEGRESRNIIKILIM